MTVEEVTEQHIGPIEPDWRESVPTRFQSVDDRITARQIAGIFGYSIVYVRKLYAKRCKEDKMGNLGSVFHALPRPLDASARRIFWDAAEIIDWGMKTGRLDVDTGEPHRLWSPGRPRSE